MTPSTVLLACQIDQITSPTISRLPVRLQGLVELCDMYVHGPHEVLELVDVRAQLSEEPGHRCFGLLEPHLVLTELHKVPSEVSRASGRYYLRALNPLLQLRDRLPPLDDIFKPASSTPTLSLRSVLMTSWCARSGANEASASCWSRMNASRRESTSSTETIAANTLNNTQLSDTCYHNGEAHVSLPCSFGKTNHTNQT